MKSSDNFLLKDTNFIKIYPVVADMTFRNKAVPLIFRKFKISKANILTRWKPAYGIFVLWFWPKKQQFSGALPTP